MKSLSLWRHEEFLCYAIADSARTYFQLWRTTFGHLWNDKKRQIVFVMSTTLCKQKNPTSVINLRWNLGTARQSLPNYLRITEQEVYRCVLYEIS